MAWEENARRFQRSVTKDEKEVSNLFSYSANEVDQAIVHTRQDLVLVVYALKRISLLLSVILCVLLAILFQMFL